MAHLAWWHDHSALVIDALRAGRKPYDGTDPANSTDALNERAHREHLDDPAEVTRRAFSESFKRLLASSDTHDPGSPRRAARDTVALRNL